MLSMAEERRSLQQEPVVSRFIKPTPNLAEADPHDDDDDDADDNDDDDYDDNDNDDKDEQLVR